MNRLAYASLVLALAALPAVAERADREKEAVVIADKWLGDDANKASVFEGNVVITQGTMRITASKVTIRENKDKQKSYVALGAPVTFRQKRDKGDDWVEGFAERAEFSEGDEVLRLFNRAKVKSSQNEITSDFISYDMRREVAEAVGAAPGQQPPPNSRVKVIIVPQKGAAAAAKDDSAKANLKRDPEMK